MAPPPIIFERLKLPQQIRYRRKENLSESPNHQKYWENILVSRFYEQFSRNRRNLSHFRKFEKISNSQNMNILYIILKHVIWRFQIYNLFREIFKFREDKSNNVFREIRKCFRKTAKSLTIKFMIKTQFYPCFWVGDMQYPYFWVQNFHGIHVLGFEFYPPYAHSRIQIYEVSS